MNGFTKLSEIKEAFDLLDNDKKGYINIPNTIQFMKLMDYDKENPLMFDLISSLGDGDVDYDTFKDKFIELLKEEDEKLGLQRIYDLFINDPSREDIDLTVLQNTCRNMGESFKDSDLQYILDIAGDGTTLSFNKFVKFMEKKYTSEE
ncbi:MAG: hypothetical protein MJ252_22090 [archaeon]|nr:hypothetical protein [archaeon]